MLVLQSSSPMAFFKAALLSLCFFGLTPTHAKISAKTQTACHNAGGRWVTVLMQDSGIPSDGWQGNYLHFQDDSLEDLYTFTLADGSSSGSESFCLDHTGDEFSKCYTIWMDDEGYDSNEVSWEVKITTANAGASWRTSSGVDQWVSGASSKDHGWNAASGVMEAVKEGKSPAFVKILCGRLFKKLGRYSMKQIGKVNIDQMSNEDNMFYKSQSALAKIESYAQQLNLYEENGGLPNKMDVDDWFDGEVTTTTAAETTGAVTTTTTTDQSCDGCGSSCTGCAVKSWKGDGQCDDDNNSCGCDWDGGDCCGDSVQTQYCSDCACVDPGFSSRLLRG